MPFEVELKFPVRATADLQARLTALEGRALPPVTQQDTYFSHPGRRFDQTDEALRLRESGEVNRLTYKGPKVDPESKTRIEVDVPLAAGRQTAARIAELLGLIGFEPVATVRKERQAFDVHWRGWPVNVAVDIVEDLGTFVELETRAEESQIAPAREALQNLAGHLGLADSIRESYLEQLLQKRGQRNHTASGPERPMT